MKKILFLLLVPVLCFAQGKFDTGMVLNSAISATELCTSSVFLSRPKMSFNLFAWDRSKNDSVNIRYYFDMATDTVTYNDWAVRDSVDLSTDSTWTPYDWTEFPLTSFHYSRVRAKGLTDTVIDTTATVRVKKSNYYERR